MKCWVWILMVLLTVAGCDSGGSSTEDNDTATADETATDADTVTADELLPTDDATENDDDFAVIEGTIACTGEDQFWIYDLSAMPPKNIQICAHVRAEGKHVRVLVAEDSWDKTVDAAAVRTLLTAWENETPADPSTGIFDQVTGLFGPVPDEFDGYPGLYLFLYEMASYGGNSFDGYFRVDDQYEGSASNLREMIHINVKDKLPTTEYMLSVQAHEFQHLIQWGLDGSEDPWLNESMSELAMAVTGFGADEAWVNSWLTTPAEPLMSNGPDYDYGVFMLFGSYLYDRFGAAFVTELVKDPANGHASLETALGALDEPMTFAEFGADLALAVLAQDDGYDNGKYGFKIISPAKKATAKVVIAEPVEATVAANGGMAFFKDEAFVGNSDSLVVTLTGAGNLTGRAALLTDAGIVEVLPLALDENTPTVTVQFAAHESGTALVVLFNATATAATVTTARQ